MENKTPFAVHAARSSVIIPVILFIFNKAGHQIIASWGLTSGMIWGGIGLSLYLIALGLAIAALVGIKKHGSKGILGFAITGIIINGFVLMMMGLLMPALAKIKASQISQADQDVFFKNIKLDMIQMQETGTVTARTFTIEKDGKLAPLLQLINDGMVNQMKLSQAYNEKIEHVDIALYLEPEQLIDPNALAYSQSQVLLLQTSYQEFMSELTSQAKTTLQKMKLLDYPMAFKRGFITGYQDNEANTILTCDRLKESHFNFTQAVLTLLAFMEEKKELCELQDGYLIFELDEDLEQFNKLYDQIAALEEAMLNSANQAMDYVQETIDTVP